MGRSALEIVQFFQQQIPFFEKWEEHFATSDYAICADADEQTDELIIPQCLRHSNTELPEIFKPNWSDPEALETVVVRLDDLCSYWENVYGAHAAACAGFGQALRRERDYCLYLRSFSSVAMNVLDEPVGRAVAYFNNENLDRNLVMALANAKEFLNPVTCQHLDDMSLLEGKWRIPAFRVHDHTWKQVVEGAVEGAKCFVFYLDDSTPSVAFELDLIRARNLNARTILVHTDKAPLPPDAGSFAAAFRVTDFITLSEDLMHAQLKDNAVTCLRKLMNDQFRPATVDETLLSIPCNLVDPKVPVRFMDKMGNFNPFQTFFVTPSNLTAFDWFLTGLPSAMQQWNEIDRMLFKDKQAPGIAQVNQLLQSLFLGQVGAASLGLTASLSGLIGLRAIVAHLVVVPDQAKGRARNNNLLQVIAIANRFDDLTQRHDWRKYNDEWRNAITEGRFYVA